MRRCLIRLYYKLQLVRYAWRYRRQIRELREAMIRQANLESEMRGGPFEFPTSKI